MRTFVLAAALIAVALPAAADSGNAVDLSPIIEALIALAVAAITAVAGVVGLWVKARWGIDLDLKHNAILNDALDRAADYAIAKAPNRVTISNDMVRLGVNYVVTGAPVALNYLKVTPEHIADMIEARLARKLGVAEP